MANLLQWVGSTEEHPLIASSVFHYEFEFIHPFEDGNGRMGRLWQTLILTRWRDLFAHLPVESMVHAHQSAYYDAIRQSSAARESTTFIAFMLEMIRLAVTEQTCEETHFLSEAQKARVRAEEVYRIEIRKGTGYRNANNRILEKDIRFLQPSGWYMDTLVSTGGRSSFCLHLMARESVRT